MVLAMRNLGQVTDPDVLVDNLTPVCADVESALVTFSSIYYISSVIFLRHMLPLQPNSYLFSHQFLVNPSI